MKLTSKIVLISILLTCLSCGKQQSERTVENSQNTWQEIEINTRTEKLRISKFSDSADYEQDLNNIAFQILPENGEITKKKIIKKKIYFSRSEKDSLAKFVYKSATKPTFTDITATDYAGSVVLKYNTGTTTLICEYNSVGDWSIVSETTKKIYELISKKVDISKS